MWIKKSVAFLVSVLIAILSVFTVGVSNFNLSDFLKQETFDEYYKIINGCSQTTLKKFADDEVLDVVIYSGLDISPSIIAKTTMFYLKNNIDTEKLTTDVTYSTKMAKKLDDYFESKKVVNTKSEELLKVYGDILKKNSRLFLPTLGAFTLSLPKSKILEFMSNDNVSFVIVGNHFVLKKGDINSDDYINYKDCVIVQQYIAENYGFDNNEEKAFLNYSSDFDENGVVDINDVTKMQCR